LLRCFGPCAFNRTPEILHVAVLLVRNSQQAGEPRRRHRPAHPFHVHLQGLFRGAVAHVNRVLHHREAVLLQCLAKLRRVAPLGFGVGRQIEKNEQPHDPISIQT